MEYHETGQRGIEPGVGKGPGLRVRHGLACVDASVPGLLASRERIEAELLAELDALLEVRGRKLT